MSDSSIEGVEEISDTRGVVVPGKDQVEPRRLRTQITYFLLT